MVPFATLHVLTGPTAVGKTDLALAWAERQGAEILSCDSLLFYRGMDIGTAKPTRAELARVRHHLVDVCEPHEPMDVVRYTTLARAVVEDAARRRVPLLVTGGSGFYLRAFFAPITDGIQISDTIRAEVEALWAGGGLPALLERLRALNPDGFGDLDSANPRRVIRALERCLASGRTLPDLQAAFAAQPGPFHDCRIRFCVLDRDPAELSSRVQQRVEAMLAAGLVAEVRRLREVGFTRNPSACGAIGYRETLAFLEGAVPSETALVEQIAANTRALVKKQRTWFRTQLPAHTAIHPASVRDDGAFADLPFTGA